MWGWFNRIVDSLASIVKGVAEIPTTLRDYIGKKLNSLIDNFYVVQNKIIEVRNKVTDGFEELGIDIRDFSASTINSLSNLPKNIKNSLSSLFEDVKNAVTSIPNAILNGIKSIFIPDAEYIRDSTMEFADELKMKFGLNTDVFTELFTAEQPVQDVESNYTISGVGTFKLKFFDRSYFVQGVTYFRPFIRGFLVLMLFLYHVKQLIGFFGYNAGVVDGRNEHISSSRKEQ